MSEYLQTLKEFLKDCTFTAVNALGHWNELTRDAFVYGLSSRFIWQRLLENDDLNLTKAFYFVKTLDQV